MSSLAEKMIARVVEASVGLDVFQGEQLFLAGSGELSWGPYFHLGFLKGLKFKPGPDWDRLAHENPVVWKDISLIVNRMKTPLSLPKQQKPNKPGKPSGSAPSLPPQWSRNAKTIVKP